MGRNSLHPLQYTTTSHLLVKQAAQQIFTTVVMPTHQAHGMALELCGCWNRWKGLEFKTRIQTSPKNCWALADSWPHTKRIWTTFWSTIRQMSISPCRSMSCGDIYHHLAAKNIQKQHCCECLEELGVAVSSSRATWWAGRSGARGTQGRGTSGHDGHGKGRQSIKNKLIHGKP